MNKKYQAFTLVELVVVITILAVLGTISFISLIGFNKSARESVRISDLNTMSRTLDFFYTQNSYYPNPSDSFEVTYSGGLAWNQGTFGEETRIITARISQIPTDPLTRNEYAYSVTNTKQEFELGAISETILASSFGITQQVNAANNYYSNIKGNYNKQIITVKNPTKIYILGVPTLITGEINDVTVEEILANGSFAYRNGQNLPGSYSGQLIEGQTIDDLATAFSGGVVVDTSIPVIYSGTIDLLNQESERQKFADNLVSYYQGSNLTEANLQGLSKLLDPSMSVSTNALAYVEGLILSDIGGLPGDQIAINQENFPNPSEFITVWDIPSDGYNFSFPVKSGGFKYDFTIDWGDGSPIAEIESAIDPDLNHVYASSGEYTITAEGNMQAFENTGAHRNDLVRVISMGDMLWEDLSSAFSNNEYLISVDAPGDTSLVTDMGTMFAGTVALTTVPDFNMENVLSINSMFAGSSVNSVYFSNTGNVTDMSAMFSGASVETVTLLDTGNAVAAGGMFGGTINLVSVNLPNTQNLTSVGGMFGGSKVVSVSIPNLQSLVSGAGMFSGVNFLESISIPNLQSFASPGGFISGAPSLESISLGNLTSLVTTAGMIGSVKDLTSITLTGTENLEDITSMYSYASNPNILNSITISDTSSITRMINFLQGASLFDQDLSAWDVSSVVDPADCSDFAAGTTAWTAINKPALPAACLTN